MTEKRRKRKSSSGNYSDRIHAYVVEGIKMFGNDGWKTSIIQRPKDKWGAELFQGEIKIQIVDSKL